MDKFEYQESLIGIRVTIGNVRPHMDEASTSFTPPRPHTPVPARKPEPYPPRPQSYQLRL
jgi:hypothetical protein